MVQRVADNIATLAELLGIFNAVKAHPSKNGLDTRVRMVQIARMYQVQGLEKAALASLKAHCDSLAFICPWGRDSWRSPCADEEDFANYVGLAVRQAYNDERSSFTLDDVRDLLCGLVKRHKTTLHKYYSFCKMLGKVNAFFQDRCAILGCENCRWAKTAIEFELARAQFS